ncbi:hypothetical protein GPECTOR_77g26 [Gonium pectorale]|uniref:PPP4R2 protein n=1 Tax=Gonium pectorale TaxID=33097 RepID=A0A150G224_GONPE|nr:hypothetical protein GPECTOR_77g26 [Gonium pectorale]|eukprot:KXZ43929.1 hypothetical protein GPECTOR_77g26 [Gonium pectorale]
MDAELHRFHLQVLTAYDAETRVEVGPPGPDSVSETVERFQKLLAAFSDAPWTFQRLCEILLEPKRQYSRLPKLVLAIEKCLLVTTEQPPDTDLPPLPLCSSLGPVNVNPPTVYTNTHHHASHGGHGAGSAGGADDSAAFTNSMLDLRHHSHNHHHVGNHVGTPEHIEEDHWWVHFGFDRMIGGLLGLRKTTGGWWPLGPHIDFFE